LSPEVRERILNTYRQTLELARKGDRQEARLGCDFIARLDPSFEAVRTLRRRLAEGDGPVEVSDLIPAAEEDPGDATNPSGLPAPEAGADLAEPPAPAAGSAASAHAGGDALTAALSDLLDKRELRRLVQVAEDRRAEVAGNAALRKIVETAYAWLEAEPYVHNFLAAARKALEAGDLAGTEHELEKARSLDPSHPDIAEVARQRNARLAAASGKTASEQDPFTATDSLFDEGSGDLFDAEGAEIPDVEPDLILPGEDIFEAAVAPSGQPGASGTPPAWAPPGGDDQRVRELLDEGQADFDRQDYQGAINAWSRIFLISIDHPEASRRIEEARRLKEEGERKAEEVFHDATVAFVGGDAARARQRLEEVLATAPGHAGARELFDRLEREGVPTAPLPQAPASAPVVPAPSSPVPLPWESTVSTPPVPVAGGAALKPPPLAVPGPAEPVPARPPEARKVRPGGRGRKFLTIGGGVLVLVILVGFFAWQQWDHLFPNSEPRQEEGGDTSDRIARARRQYEAGKVKQAVTILSKMPEDDPRYDEAQELIARWQAELEPGEAGQADGGSGAEGEGEADGESPSPDELSLRERILAAARQAHGEGEHILADLYFQRAAKIAPLDEATAALHGDSLARIAPLSQEIDLFRQREWEFVLPRLWRMHQEEPENRDVVRLIVDSYYNLAVRDLQRGDAILAADRFKEALALRPDSADLERQRLFAETYRNRSKDLLYRIYVKYLPYR